MKAIFLAVCLLVAASTFSQEKILSITNAETGKVTVFNQNERVKIKTIQGDKIKGNLLITDDNQIMIKDILVPVSNIEKIKRHPLLMNIFVSGTLFIFGAYAIFGGWLILAWSGDAIGAIILHTGAAFIATGIIAPNLFPNLVEKNASNIKVETVLQ
jgi:hypothetical protein